MVENPFFSPSFNSSIELSNNIFPSQTKKFLDAYHAYHELMSTIISYTYTYIFILSFVFHKCFYSKPD